MLRRCQREADIPGEDAHAHLLSRLYGLARGADATAGEIQIGQMKFVVMTCNDCLNRSARLVQVGSSAAALACRG